MPELAAVVPAKSALLGARRRLGPEAMRAVFERVAAPASSPATVGAFWRGLRTWAVDGLQLEVPDSTENRVFFGGPTTRNSEGEIFVCGYPQARVVVLVETGTRAVRGARVGTYHDGERGLAGELAQLLGPGDLVLFDRGFSGVALWLDFLASGAAVVMRGKSNIARARTRPLPDGSYLAEMWEDGRVGQANAAHVTVRVIEYTLGGEKIRLFTSLLDVEVYPAAELAALYAERWQCEVGILQLKALQMKRAAVLRSHHPDQVVQEIWAHLTLNHALTRLTTLIADARGQDPARISFVQVLKQVRRSVIRQLTRTVREAADAARAIAADLRRYRNPSRGPRTSERRVKRIRHRFQGRRPAPPGTPVTTPTTPARITLLPYQPG
ncbi:IS4 family transposase [Streptacidiphilus rugosus]|uniref:IS4 family transposase n=1 Tax=Streptacidiphilus rugosus TaxID=405783 RepID=UPI00068A2091|nr:IS4 family transposase [Streptacidiphilus rugosus]